MTRTGKFLVAGAVLIPVVAMIALRVSVTSCPGPLYPDKGRLYRIAQALVAIAPDGDFPMKDGALDVYAVFRNGSISLDGLRRWGGQARIDFTDDEIPRGDYTNFPWERCRSDMQARGRPFPLLWEREPNDQGLVLVALSDGYAYFWTPEQLDAALKGNQ